MLMNRFGFIACLFALLSLTGSLVKAADGETTYIAQMTGVT